MGRRTSRLAGRSLASGLAALALGCGAESDRSHEPDFGASVAPRATLLLTPDVLHVGEIVTAEVVVVTPPDYRVRNVPTQPIDGVALLGAQTLPPEQHEHHWTHRTRYRLRPEATGDHVFSSLQIDVERTDGTVEALELAERRFEVTSVRDRFPDREEPFGLEEPDPTEATPGDRGFVPGFVLGALLSCLVAIAVWGVRRQAGRARESREIPERLPPVSLFEWTERELGQALETLQADPRRAASVGAHLLRVYMARRFGSETEAATTEELERRRPALAERTLWPDFVRILHNFDDVRFRPSEESPRSPGDPRIRSALEDSRQLIEASRPTNATRNT